MITKNQSDIARSEQVILNRSVDDKFDILAVELMGYDPLGKDGDGNVVGTMNRITTNAMGDYGTNDIIESGGYTYVGKESASGSWIIQRIDKSSGTSIRYATELNNDTITSYTDAWAGIESLVYGTYSQAF